MLPVNLGVGIVLGVIVRKDIIVNAPSPADERDAQRVEPGEGGRCRQGGGGQCVAALVVGADPNGRNVNQFSVRELDRLVNRGAQDMVQAPAGNLDQIRFVNQIVEADLPGKIRAAVDADAVLPRGRVPHSA